MDIDLKYTWSSTIEGKYHIHGVRAPARSKSTPSGSKRQGFMDSLELRFVVVVDDDFSSVIRRLADDVLYQSVEKRTRSDSFLFVEGTSTWLSDLG